MCAGTPRCADQSCCARHSETSGSASGPRPRARFQAFAQTVRWPREHRRGDDPFAAEGLVAPRRSRVLAHRAARSPRCATTRTRPPRRGRSRSSRSSSSPGIAGMLSTSLAGRLLDDANFDGLNVVRLGVHRRGVLRAARLLARRAARLRDRGRGCGARARTARRGTSSGSPWRPSLSRCCGLARAARDLRRGRLPHAAARTPGSGTSSSRRSSSARSPGRSRSSRSG